MLLNNLQKISVRSRPLPDSRSDQVLSAVTVSDGAVFTIGDGRATSVIVTAALDCRGVRGKAGPIGLCGSDRRKKA